MVGVSMNRRPHYGVAVAALILSFGLTHRANAQISFTINFDNSGFYSASRQTSITTAANYIASQFDGRGNVTISLDSLNLGPSTLASAGTNYFIVPGTFSNGTTFQQATSGGVMGPQATGTFNSGFAGWYSGASASVPGSQTDMQSVALHELTHALAFNSLIFQDGSGLGGQTPGTPDTYSQYDKLLSVGSAANSPRLMNPNGTFNLAQLAGLTSNNVFFQGELARQANGGNAVQIFAPNPYQDGSSLSHLDNLPNGVMLPAISNGVAIRAYTNVEIAMLIDIGWNQYSWTNATGNWGGNTANTIGSHWRNMDGKSSFSPVGTITPNMVLTFGGTGGYTSTNDLSLTATGDRFLVNRVILNATAGTSTIASNGTNVLRFDTTIGITPLIRQDGAGAFTISHPAELTNSGLQLGGDGAGRVNLSGTISTQTGQTSLLTKQGASTYVLSGNNTYNGGTSVSAGTLLVNGQTVGNSGTGTGAVTVTGGILGGTGRIGGIVTISGGVLSPGDSGPGLLTINNNLSFANNESSRSLSVILNGATAGTQYDRVNVNGTVNLTGATLSFTRGYSPGLNDLLFLIANDGTDAVVGNFAGLSQGAQFDLNGVTAFISYQGDVNLNSPLGGNDVVIFFTPVPEPSTILGLTGVTLATAGWVRRRVANRDYTSSNSLAA